MPCGSIQERRAATTKDGGRSRARGVETVRASPTSTDVGSAKTSTGTAMPTRTKPSPRRRPRPPGRAPRRHRVWLRPHLPAIVGILVLGLVFAALDAVWPVISGWIIDLVTGQTGKSTPVLVRDLEPLTGLMILGLVALGVIIASRAIGLWRGYLTIVMSARVTHGLRTMLYNHLLRLPMGKLNDLKSGSIISRLSNDVDATSGLVQQAIISPLAAIIRLVLVLALLLWLNWAVTLTSLLILAAAGFVYQKAVSRVRPIFRSMSKDRSATDGRVAETFNGMRVVRSFAREAHEGLAYGVGHHTAMRKQVWGQLKINLLILFWEVLLPWSASASSGWGVFVLRGDASIGEVITIQILSFQVLQPVMIFSSLTETQRGLAALDRVYEILDVDADPTARARHQPPRITELRFENVGFEYRSDDDQAKAVLHDIDLRVAGSSTIA